MFKLPTCPHCKTVYHYRETKQALRQKQNTCYHCQKHFTASLFPGIIVIGLLILSLSVGINILMISRMNALNLILPMIITVLFLVLLYFLIPFFISFRKTEDSSDKMKTNKKKH